MNDIELLLGLLVAVAALTWLASRINVAYPVLLVLGGLGIAVIPGLPRVERPAEVRRARPLWSPGRPATASAPGGGFGR